VAISATIAEAVFLKPKEFIVLASESGEQFLRKRNSESVIEVRSSETLEIEYEVKLYRYSDLFSKVRLSGDGLFVIHVRGNHTVRSTSDLCVEIFQRGELVAQYTAKEFWDEIPKNMSEFMTSVSPSALWHRKILDVSDNLISIQLDDKRYAWIYYDCSRNILIREFLEPVAGTDPAR